MGGVNILHRTASLVFLLWCLMCCMKSTCHGKALSSSYHSGGGFRHFINRFKVQKYEWRGWEDDEEGRQQSCGVIPKVKVKGRTTEPGVALFGQIPWQAGIFDKKTNTLICSGTLVSSELVLTSAVCLLLVESTNGLEIRLGDWDISDKEFVEETYDHVTALITDVIFYPDGPIGEVAPVAVLLKLDKAVDFKSYPQISPLCIPPLDFSFMEKRERFEYCLVSGWGTWSHDELDKSSESFGGGSKLDKNDITLHGKSWDFGTGISIRFPIFNASLTEGHDDVGNASSRGGAGSTNGENAFSDNLLIDSNLLETRESERKPHASSSIKIPDPLDYAEPSSSEELETLTPWSSDESSAKSSLNEIRPNQATYYETQILNNSTFIFIPDSYEANIHHNRRKYKMGKARNQKTVSLKSTGNQDEPLLKLLLKGSLSGTEEGKYYIGKSRLRRLYQSHTELAKEYQLKLFKVKAQENCNDEKAYDETTSKYCVSPVDGVFPRFGCMVDFGSPVFCVSPDPVKPIHPRRSKRFKPFQYEETIRAYLAGFVSGRNSLCFVSSSPEDAHSDYLNRAEFIPFDRNIIQFIHDNV